MCHVHEKDRCLPSGMDIFGERAGRRLGLGAGALAIFRKLRYMGLGRAYYGNAFIYAFWNGGFYDG